MRIEDITLQEKVGKASNTGLRSCMSHTVVSCCFSSLTAFHDDAAGAIGAQAWTSAMSVSPAKFHLLNPSDAAISSELETIQPMHPLIDVTTGWYPGRPRRLAQVCHKSKS